MAGAVGTVVLGLVALAGCASPGEVSTAPAAERSEQPTDGSAGDSPADSSTAVVEVSLESILDEQWEEYGVCASPEPLQLPAGEEGALDAPEDPAAPEATATPQPVEPLIWETGDGPVEVVALGCLGNGRPLLGLTAPDGTLHQLQVDDFAGTTRFGGISAYRVTAAGVEVDWWAATTPEARQRTGTAILTWVDGAPQVGDGSLPPEVVVDEVIYGHSGFITPRAEVGCLLLSGSADCSLADAEFTPAFEDEAYCAERELELVAIRMSDLPAPPSWYCTDTYLHTYADITDGGRWARTDREWLEERGRRFAVLDYGRTYLHSGVECTVSDVDGRDQVRCDQLAANRWFELSTAGGEHS